MVVISFLLWFSDDLSHFDHQQVINVCMEAIVSVEMKTIEKLEQQRRLDVAQSLESDGPRSSADGGMIIDQFPDNSSLDKSSVNSGSGASKEGLSGYYDADESLEDRKGARFPVMGASLTKTGDQLFAPYLQRPVPLTDDVITQRRSMMERQGGTGGSVSVKHRMEVAQRLQKPKLLSDMMSFKAANPHAVFQDFVTWYGHPENPLDSFGPSCDAVMKPNLSIPDPAIEPDRVLEDTKAFWTATWEKADPVPAKDQDPLFDAETTLEMALDYLETIHPASLLCQVMAVNLAMAYYTLTVSAGEASLVGVVRMSLARCRESVESALHLLSLDVSSGDRNPVFSESEISSAVMSLVSIDSLSACSRVCMTLSEAEVQVARSMSLLEKFPQQFDLVDSIMSKPNGTLIEVPNPKIRIEVLKSICSLQKDSNTPRECVLPSEAKPSVREYLLRNSDESQPSQLLVKYKSSGCNIDADEDCSELVLAMSSFVSAVEETKPCTNAQNLDK